MPGESGYLRAFVKACEASQSGREFMAEWVRPRSESQGLRRGVCVGGPNGWASIIENRA